MIFKWINFYFILFVVSFIFFDEEPFFDITDFNIVHIFFLIVCFIIIIFENIVKSKYGQFLFKDQVLMFSTFSYWFFLQNYVLIVLIIFFFHCLVPLEIELFELVEIYNTLFVWTSTVIFINLSILVFFFFLILIINFYINWNNKKLFFYLILFLFFILIYNLLFILWDFFFSSMTSVLFWNNFKIFYLQSKSSLTYDNMLYVLDQFDWHKSNSSFFIFRFEDLYIYIIQVLTVFSLFCLLFILFIIIIDNLNTIFINKNVSFLSFSILYTWFNNCLYISIINYFLTFLVGLRVIFKVLIENWDYALFF